MVITPAFFCFQERSVPHMPEQVGLQFIVIFEPHPGDGLAAENGGVCLLVDFVLLPVTDKQVVRDHQGNKKLTWSISENTVGAKISSSGKLTTKKVTVPTVVIITAAAQDGSGMTATHTVTIYPATTSVALSADGYEKIPTTLAVGKTLKLVASCNEGAANQYTWSSSSTKVATVDVDGVITAITPGTVTITATANDGTGKKAAIKLTVVQLMENLTLSGNDFVVGGKSLTLKAAITPANTTNRKLTWSISTDDVNAKIDSSGKLTTKAVKTAVEVTITAAAQDGSGMKATHKVTIYPATTKVTLTTEDGGEVPKELAAGTELKLKGFCDGAANKYTWKSNKGWGQDRPALYG